MPADAIKSRWELRKLGAVAGTVQRGASPGRSRNSSPRRTTESPGLRSETCAQAQGASRALPTRSRLPVPRAITTSQSRRLHPSNSMSAGRPYLVGIEGRVHDGGRSCPASMLMFLPRTSTTSSATSLFSDNFESGQKARSSRISTSLASKNSALAYPRQGDARENCCRGERRSMIALSRSTGESRCRTRSFSPRFRPLSESPLASIVCARRSVTQSIQRRQLTASIMSASKSIEPGTGPLLPEDPDATDATSTKRLFAKGDVLYGEAPPSPKQGLADVVRGRVFHGLPCPQVPIAGRRTLLLHVLPIP